MGYAATRHVELGGDVMTPLIDVALGVLGAGLVIWQLLLKDVLK
ncbi:hypothetical protein TPY_1250 [Sulfobacillus acidophilus TPY]|nr:hypothetical protein TPY_1250 [Sulfobacillus acidophilus TPY]